MADSETETESDAWPKWTLAALLFLAGVGLGALVHMWMTGGDRPAPQDQAVASSRRSLGADAPMPVPSDIASGGKSYGTSALTPAPAPVQEVAAASSEPAAPMASRPESPAAAARPIPVSAPAPRPAPVREKAAAAPAATASALVARIGEKSVISEQDLTDFSGSASCYGPDAINSRNAGFMRMLESSITEEVLRRDAHTEITPEEYAKEVKRVDQGTRAPDILICIKKYFGWTPEGGWTESGLRRYERVFLRPHMGGGLHQFVMFDRKVQSEAYDRQDAMLAKGLKGEAFSDLAQSYKVDFTSRTYSYTEPQESSGTMHSPEMRWSPFEKQFIDENLKGLSPGQVKPKAIDTASDITLVKLVSVAGDKYKVETLRIPKIGYEKYYGSRPKLRCAVYDSTLKAWVTSITGNEGLRACAFE